MVRKKIKEPTFSLALECVPAFSDTDQQQQRSRGLSKRRELSRNGVTVNLLNCSQC